MTSDRRRCGASSHPQAGAVGVGSDHGEAVSWQVAPAHREGDDTGEVPGQKVLKREENWVYRMTDYKYVKIHQPVKDDNRPWWTA